MNTLLVVLLFVLIACEGIYIMTLHTKFEEFKNDVIWALENSVARRCQVGELQRSLDLTDTFLAEVSDREETGRMGVARLAEYLGLELFVKTDRCHYCNEVAQKMAGIEGIDNPTKADDEFGLYEDDDDCPF